MKDIHIYKTGLIDLKELRQRVKGSEGDIYKLQMPGKLFKIIPCYFIEMCQYVEPHGWIRL